MRILYTQAEIQRRTHELASRLRDTFTAGKTPLFIGLLNGAFMFYKDLVTEVNSPIECDFMRVKSYTGKKQGDIKITKDLDTSVSGKDVYIVDDIFDSGNTMRYVINHLSKDQPNSISVVTLLVRDISPILNVHTHHGFVIQNEWVCGYGMDSNDGTMRNNTNIYEI